MWVAFLSIFVLALNKYYKLDVNGKYFLFIPKQFQ